MQESCRPSNDSVNDEYGAVSPKKPIDVSDETFAHNGRTAGGGSLTSEHDRPASNNRTTVGKASTSGTSGISSTSGTAAGSRTSTSSARSVTTVTVNKVSQRRHTIDFF